MSDKNYYAVSVGKRTGIFQTWTLCNKQVHRHNGATFEGFELIDEAVSWLISHGIERSSIEVYDKKGDQWSLSDFLNDTDDYSPLYVDLPTTDCASGVVRPTINNAILSYIVYSMQSGTAEKIKSVICGHFSLDDIINAKDDLWRIADNTIIGGRKTRRDGAINSEKKSHADDIVTAMYLLDAASSMPLITLNATDLGCIPRSHPEELNDISLVDRLNKMEERLSALTEVVDRTVGINMTLKDQINVLQQNNLATYPTLNVTPSSNNMSYSAAVKSPPPQNTAILTQPRTLSDNTSTRPKVPILAAPGDQQTSTRPKIPSSHAAPEDQRQERRVQRPVRRPGVVAHIPALAQHQHLTASSQSLDASSVISNANTDDFQEPAHVARKNRRNETRRKHVIQGSRAFGNIRGAPEPLRHAFIYRVSDETTTDKMHGHIREMGVDINSIECISNANARFKSFKVTTTVSKFDELFNPEMWPTGICVRKYIPPRRGLPNTQHE